MLMKGAPGLLSPVAQHAVGAETLSRFLYADGTLIMGQLAVVVAGHAVALEKAGANLY